jgi:hypothetical protein
MLRYKIGKFTFFIPLSNLGSKGQKSSALNIEVELWFPGSIVFNPFHFKIPYHTYGLPMGGRVLNILSNPFFIHFIGKR